MLTFGLVYWRQFAVARVKELVPAVRYIFCFFRKSVLINQKYL